MKKGSSQVLLVITCIVLGISVFAASTIASMKRGDESAAKQGFSLNAEAPLSASVFTSDSDKKTEESTSISEIESKKETAEEPSSEAVSAAEAASREVSADMIALQETEEEEADEAAERQAEEEAAEAERLAEEARAAEEALWLAQQEEARAAEEEAARLAELEEARAAEEEARAAEEEAARLAAEEEARAAEEEAARLAQQEEARAAEEEAARLAEEAAAQEIDNSAVTYSGDYDYSADAAAYAISGGIYGYSYEETYLLACTVSAEVGWSPYETQLAVANVILDRAANTGSIRSAVFAAGQFAVTWDGALLRTFRDGPRDSALQSTIDALNGADLRPRPYYYFNNRDMSGEFEGVVGEWIGDGYFYLIE